MSLTRGFEVAIAASLLSDAPRPALRLGASLFAGARLLSVGCNLYSRSHPASNNGRDFHRSTHAEHRCLLRRQWNPTDNLTMYVARRKADGSSACSKPCNNCLELARIAGVRRIRYFGDDGKPKEITL